VERFCSASAAHGTVRTEVESLGLLACLANLKLERSLGSPCRAPLGNPVPTMRKSPYSSQPEGLAWKAVAQPHLPMALLAQKRRHWGCLLVLPPQTRNIPRGFLPGASCIPAPKASSPSVCVSEQAVPWADESDQHLPGLAPYVSELSGDVRVFEGWLPGETERDYIIYVGSLSLQDNQAVPISVLRCR